MVVVGMCVCVCVEQQTSELIQRDKGKEYALKDGKQKEL